METITWGDQAGGSRWIQLEGELDSAGTLKVKEQFQAAVSEGEGDIVVVMSGVTFLSSMGVGLLLRTREELSKGGRTLKLSGVPSAVRTALELMNVGAVFEEV